MSFPAPGWQRCKDHKGSKNMDSQYRFCFSEDHLIASFVRYRRQLWWRRPFIGLKWFLAAALLALLGLTLFLGSVALCAIVGGIMGALLLGWPIDAWFIRRNLRSSPFHNDDIAFTISESGAHIVGRDSEARIGWASFSKARRFADGLLLFQGPGFVNWLPDSAATDKAAIANAQELARSKIQDYRDA
ncbi:YcxB family protein [Massilia aquatica]|uniref:YcxB family protein n=1 Tax=Massilia aquatica TaxID=2609000 RepID=A0ABX0MC38_9BURK|nr:YcxB family protein [Massilia aquatica]NHZ43899.1 YcxB family protein [Massilia aquatica]